MRSLLFVSSALSLAVLAGFGCSSRDSESSGDEAAVTAADLNTARKAVGLLAGADGKCNRCHTASKDDMRRWGAAMQAVETNCLAPSLSLTAEQRIACLSDDPADPLATFSAAKLGFYAAGARLSALHNLFAPADAGGAGEANYQLFVRQVSMPMGDTFPNFSEADFETVRKWMLAGLPALDQALQDPDLGPCRTKVTPALVAHLSQAKNDGWGARHKDASTTMFGCGEATDPEGCLTNFDDISSTWGAEGVPQTLRKIREFTQRSHWQTRSSPDGRYVGFGYNDSAKIYDLTKPESTGIKVNAQYDPVFFPSNDGFSFSGNAGIRVCKKSVLDAAPTQISLTETGCNFIQNNVYQTIGSALDGSVYWMSTGTHVNDDGSGQATAPTGLPGFDGQAKTNLVPMVSDGVKFVPGRMVTLDLPFEGDQQLSPSSRLLVTRFGNKTGKSGYRFRKLAWNAAAGDAGAADLNVSTEDLGQICVRGTKPSSSYDERFVLTHQYVDPADSPDLPTNASNLILLDLLTGETTRITKMGSKQFAFSAHFRADGWIYFVVRDGNNGSETWVASDAALRREAAHPTP